jgi:hypothetical protein
MYVPSPALTAPLFFVVVFMSSVLRIMFTGRVSTGVSLV